MPALDWEGRAEVEGSHLRVPYRLVHCERGLSAGDDGADNLLVEGDNLAVLKSLLPYYRGRVKCVYIDPPYNTGNEGWIYSDRVESPTMRKWLHKVVGDEASDMNRHDKWLCMMYPRLRLLREFLREDGLIGVFCDNAEQHHLRCLMNDIFGESRFVSTFMWKKKSTSTNTRGAQVSAQADFIHIYSRSDAGKIKPRVASKSDRSYPRRDEEGDYRIEIIEKRDSGEYRRDSMKFEILGQRPREGKRWQIGEETARGLERANRFIVDNGIVKRKIYAHEDKDSFSAQPTILESMGSSSSALKSLQEILNESDVFDTPKPVELMRHLISISADNDSIVMDSFAGSGTTGHAVLQLNKEDGGKRRFILVEMEKEICRNVAAVRLSRAAAGGETGGGKPIAALGGGFRYCKLGRELFDEYRQIARGVKFSDLAAHVFFSETGVPIPKRADGKTPFLGATADKAVYLLFNGVLGDKTPAGGNVLNPLTLRTLPTAAKGVARIVYGESCELTKARRKRANVVFRKIPREVKSE